MSDDAPHYFRTQLAAVSFLSGQGFKISKSKFNRDFQEGLIPCTSDKQFRAEDLLAYAQNIFSPPKSAVPPEPVRATLTEAPAENDLPPEFRGLCLGIMADGVINVSEAEQLAAWLANSPQAKSYAMTRLRKRLEEIMHSGDFTCRRGKELFNTLKGLLKGSLPKWMKDTALPAECGSYNGRPIRGALMLTPEVPGLYDLVAHIDFSAGFCFSGIFAFGERSDCEAAARAKGGWIASRPLKSETCYLVVGCIANPDWAHGNYGRKIEQAMRYRTEGAAIKIVSEDTWAGKL